MQVAYQSDEFDDTSSYDATFTDRTDEEEDEKGEGKDQVIDADVERRPQSEVEKPWWKQLGPRTRRTARVNYTEEKIIPTQSPPKVCYGGLIHLQGYLKMVRRCCKKFRGHRVSTIVLHGADIPRRDIQTVQQTRWTRAPPGTAELVSGAQILY
jgi:hypothetical protein